MNAREKMKERINKLFIYQIQGFEPPSEPNSFGGYGFNIKLHPRIVKKASQKEIPEEYKDYIQDTGKKIILASGLSDENITPYSFAGNEKGLTLLLQSCRVPGNACTLYLEPNRAKEIIKNPNLASSFITYNTNNIDNPTQAFTLLSLWLNWANNVDAIAG